MEDVVTSVCKESLKSPYQANTHTYLPLYRIQRTQSISWYVFAF
jgi:hypothetical protein